MAGSEFPFTWKTNIRVFIVTEAAIRNIAGGEQLNLEKVAAEENNPLILEPEGERVGGVNWLARTLALELGQTTKLNQITAKEAFALMDLLGPQRMVWKGEDINSVVLNPNA